MDTDLSLRVKPHPFGGITCHAAEGVKPAQSVHHDLPVRSLP